MRSLLILVLTLAVLISLPATAQVVDESIVGIGCFYEHPEGTPHNHPQSFWVEVGSEGVELSNYTKNTTLVCRDQQNQIVARIPSETAVFLQGDSCWFILGEHPSGTLHHHGGGSEMKGSLPGRNSLGYCRGVLIEPSFPPS